MNALDEIINQVKADQAEALGECLVDQDVVAAHLGVSPRTMEHWRQAGEGPPYFKLSERCIRYRLSSVDAWLRARTQKETD